MEQIIQIGLTNKLKIMRKEPQGFYLGAKSEEEILLPKAYTSIKDEIGDEIDVFVYRDSEDRLVATRLKPAAYLHEFALLEVVDVAPFGAFCDWGLSKHLFVPKKYQKSPFKIGEERVIKVEKDLQTDRLIGVEKFGKFLSYKKPFYKKNEAVDIFIVAKTPLGYKAIIENKHEAMLFENEVFEKLNVGDKKKAFIKQIRQDSKIDLSLQPTGKEDSEEFAKKRVLEVLRENDYTLQCNYKSSPEVIQKVFGLSKKAYKKALTSLQDEKAIIVNEDGIKSSF